LKREAKRSEADLGDFARSVEVASRSHSEILGVESVLLDQDSSDVGGGFLVVDWKWKSGRSAKRFAMK